MLVKSYNCFVIEFVSIKCDGIGHSPAAEEAAYLMMNVRF